MTAVYTIGDGAYVGISGTPGRRWRQHLRHAANGTITKLYAGMRAHPEMQMRVIAGLPGALAGVAERALVWWNRPKYNMTAGGDTAPSCVPAVRAKIAVKATGRKHTEATRVKIKAARAAQTNVAAPAFDEAQRLKMRNAQLGKKQSEETKAKRSASLKRAYAEGRKAKNRIAERNADGTIRRVTRG